MALKYIIGNWKENPATERDALKLFSAVIGIDKPGVQVAVCPPFIYFEKCIDILKKKKASKVGIGAQDVFWEETGAFTSAIGPKMLKDLRVHYVIIGHSEKRRLMNETDEMINKKIKSAIAAGLEVILCVGEPAEVRNSGSAAAEKYVTDQLKKDLKGISAIRMKKFFVAYEPIWAIGTGQEAKPEDAVKMASTIRKLVDTKYSISGLRILYGGSVNSKNIADYVQYKEIDGALVGGASLKGDEFKKIVANAASMAAKNKK